MKRPLLVFTGVTLLAAATFAQPAAVETLPATDIQAFPG